MYVRPHRIECKPSRVILMKSAVEQFRAGPAAALNDEELFLLYRDRNERDAFDALVHRYEGELYGYLRRYLGNGSLAEDIFQATFAQLHRNRKQFLSGRRFRPWLYGIATHLAIDALRKAGREQTVSIDRDTESSRGAPLAQSLPARVRTPIAEMEERELQAAIHRAVAELPEHLRAVVVLVFFQGLKYVEAAEILGIPMGTLKSRLDAALSRLDVSGMGRDARRTPRRAGARGRPRRAAAAVADPPPASTRGLLTANAPRFEPPRQFAARVCRALRKTHGRGKPR